MTLLNWRNHFTCDVFARRFGPHQLAVQVGLIVHRAHRVLRAAPEKRLHWCRRIRPGRSSRALQERVRRSLSDRFDNDLWLNRMLRRLGEAAISEAC